MMAKRPLVVLVVASAVSFIGSTLTRVALPWFVLETTGNATQTGLVGAAGTLPAFAAGLLGGALVDRAGYRRTSVATDLVSGLAVASIPLLYATVGLAYWQLLVLVLIAEAGTLPGLTARRSMLPELSHLARQPLERGNAAFESIQFLGLLVGPALAGLLITALGAANVLWLDAATFAVSAALVRLYLPTLGGSSTESGGYRQRLIAGLSFLRHDGLLLVLAIALAVSNFLNGPLYPVVLPVYALETTGSAATLGLLMAGVGLGALGGSIAYGLVGRRLRRRPLWLVGHFAFPCAYLALALQLPVLATFGVLIAGSVLSGSINPLLVTVRHERIPSELRGRVFSTFSAIAYVAQPLGTALGGVAVDRLGFVPTVTVLGLGLALLALTLLLVPVLREMDLTKRAPSHAMR
jgi:MFS family permease